MAITSIQAIGQAADPGCRSVVPILESITWTRGIVSEAGPDGFSTPRMRQAKGIRGPDAANECILNGIGKSKVDIPAPQAASGAFPRLPDTRRHPKEAGQPPLKRYLDMPA
jgi:hypothetical protein